MAAVTGGRGATQGFAYMRDASTLRSLAEKFRNLAEQADDQTAATLRELAEEYDGQARRLEPDAEPPLQSPT